MGLKAGITVALAGVALVLGGCVEFVGTPKGKQISKDEVRVKFSICDNTVEDCDVDIAKRAAERRGADETKVLLAFRTPKGTKTPNNFKPKGIEINFVRSGSYSAEMDQKAPHKNNERWQGYI